MQPKLRVLPLHGRCRPRSGVRSTLATVDAALSSTHADTGARRGAFSSSITWTGSRRAGTRRSLAAASPRGDGNRPGTGRDASGEFTRSRRPRDWLPPPLGLIQPGGAGQAFFVFQAERTSFSLSGDRPARSFALLSSGSVFHHARVSFAVSSAERKWSPLPIAFEQSICEKPASAPAQTGMSSQGLTFCSSRNFSGTQVSVAGFEDALREDSSIDFIDNFFSGPVALKTPTIPSSRVWTTKAARSRVSTYCTGSSPPPGARASPARSMRAGQ